MPETNWGCVWVWGEGNTVAKVTKAVDSAYKKAGLSIGSVEDADPMVPPLFVNRSTALGPDDVFVVEDECGWVAVMSVNHEWAPVGAHPLALVLSKKWEVLSVTSNARDGYVEYAIYRNGKLAEQTVRRETGEETASIPVALEPLAERGGFTVDELEKVLDEPIEFATYVGCEWLGYRTLFETTSLESVGRDRLRVYR